MDNSTVPSADFVRKWQRTIDMMAELLDVPAGLIMRVDGPDIEVFISSQSDGNPYNRGDREHLPGSGLYCERVVKTRKKLVVPDAMADPEWDSNPDIKLGMISYLGFPILLPEGDVFGTICVLDSKGNAYGERYEGLMLEFKDLVESHLALLGQAAALETLNAELERRLTEIQRLQGIIPMCMMCKKIRDDDGFWQAVDVYVRSHSEAEVSHGICPECLEKHYPLDEGQRGGPEETHGPPKT